MGIWIFIPRRKYNKERGGDDMAISSRLPKFAASHAKPEGGEAILCMG
ncbi:hypothetical protein SD77_0051 [Bacillus badius]|uniref:Ribose 5-phosphate isomerase B n=1 Tax=Bacillus badius TaxID=1455 RepID=A0ABR5AZR2_BACBA|nr:hypothetical protein SD77_0051 [Bacillus badius]